MSATKEVNVPGNGHSETTSIDACETAVTTKLPGGKLAELPAHLLQRNSMQPVCGGTQPLGSIGMFGPPLLPDRSDRLTLIDGIDAAAAALLARHHVTRFADIAAFRADDLAVLGDLLGDTRRIARQRWVEQAALLARGIDTPFSAYKMGSISTIEAEIAPAPKSAVVLDLAAARAREPNNRRLRRSASVAASAVGSALAASVATLLVLGHGIGDLARADFDLVERIKAPIVWMTTPRILPLSGASLRNGDAEGARSHSPIARTASLASEH